MDAITVGNVVHYQNDFWVVLSTKFNGNMLRIMRPHVGNEKREIRSSIAKLVPNAFCRVVKHNSKEVLVTPKGMLISLVSERLLKTTTPDAQMILRLAARQ
jgi:hypothetical protein